MRIGCTPALVLEVRQDRVVCGGDKQFYNCTFFQFSERFSELMYCPRNCHSLPDRTPHPNFQYFVDVNLPGSIDNGIYQSVEWGQGHGPSSALEAESVC